MICSNTHVFSFGITWSLNWEASSLWVAPGTYKFWHHLKAALEKICTSYCCSFSCHTLQTVAHWKPVTELSKLAFVLNVNMVWIKAYSEALPLFSIGLQFNLTLQPKFKFGGSSCFWLHYYLAPFFQLDWLDNTVNNDKK